MACFYSAPLAWNPTGVDTTAATTTSNVGTYGITQGSLAATSNYTLTYTGANLTVTARPITVTADALSRLYGNANPALTYTVGANGLVNGDTLSGALATAATTTSIVGTYGITQGTLSATSNYALTYNGANLTVTAPPASAPRDLPAALRAGTIVRDGYSDAPSASQFHTPVDLYMVDGGGSLSGALDPMAVCVKYQGCSSGKRAAPQPQ